MKASLVNILPRNIVKLDKRTEVLNNGLDNAYPTRMERIILSSVTAKSAAEMYCNFLVGSGFVDEINDVIIGEQNYKPITLYDLLENVAHSIAFQNGFYLHCNIGTENLKDYFVESVTPLIFKHCRLGSQDDINYSGKIAIYDNWDKSKSSKIHQKDIIKIDVFNKDKKVIESQIEKAGSFEKYKGQVYWSFFDNEYSYPLSPADVIQDDADSEYQISLFKNGELNGNLFAKYILRHAYFENEFDKADFIEKLKTFQGSKNNGSIMLIEDDISQDETGEVRDNGLKFEEIKQNINDKLFVEWEKSIQKNIRKAFFAIPPVLIDYVEGSLGNTSGESLVQAANFYNEMTKKTRMKITRLFKEIFSNFKVEIKSDFEIKPLEFGTKEVETVIKTK